MNDGDQAERNKSHFQARVSREMDEDLKVPALSAPEALAAACRILAREGHESGLAGQVSARGAAPDFLLQASIVRGTFAHWARRAG